MTTSMGPQWVWQTRPKWWELGETMIKENGPVWFLHPLFSQVLSQASDGRIVCGGGREGVWLSLQGQCSCDRPLISGAPCEHMMWLRRGVGKYEPEGFLWAHEVKWADLPSEAKWQISLPEAVEKILGSQDTARSLKSWTVSHPDLTLDMGRQLFMGSDKAVKGPLLRRLDMVQDEVIREIAKADLLETSLEYEFTWAQLVGGAKDGQIKQDLAWVLGLDGERATRLLILLTGLIKNVEIKVNQECLKKALMHQERMVREWAIKHLRPE